MLHPVVVAGGREEEGWEEGTGCCELETVAALLEGMENGGERGEVQASSGSCY